MTAITCPNCNHHIFNLSDSPGQSAGATSSPPAAAPSSEKPNCPSHGPMTFHEGGPSKSNPNKKISARYSCDVKIGDEFCPTKAVWL